MGREFQNAWRGIHEEAIKCFQFIEEEVEGDLSASVFDVGKDRESGKTRHVVVEERDMLRRKVLSKALEEHPRQHLRPVWSWNQRDKLSSAWLLSLPGPHTGLSPQIFAEGLATLLCLPSPACVSKLGEKVGRKRVDTHGDNVNTATLAGDTWRTKHDVIKTTIGNLCRFAGILTTLEALGIFAHQIPQEHLSRRNRQSMIPD